MFLQPISSPLIEGSPPRERAASWSPPTSPSAITSAPPNADAWRARFVLTAKAHAPPITLLGAVHDTTVQRLVEATAQALDSKVAPMLVDDGLGGTYFIKGADGECVSVFKPCDEEPGALNNPKQDRQEFSAPQGAGGLFCGTRVGQGALNECAAYLMDSSERARGFSRVPPTAAAYTEHSAFCSSGEEQHSPFRRFKHKVGSLQKFERAMGCVRSPPRAPLTPCPISPQFRPHTHHHLNPAAAYGTDHRPALPLRTHAHLP